MERGWLFAVVLAVPQFNPDAPVDPEPVLKQDER